MGCYNCKYLKIDDRKDGKLNGSLYYCTKIKKYVNGSDEGCDSYYKDYLRKVYEGDEVYNNGVKYSDDNTSTGIYLFLAILLSIIALIVNIF